MDTYVSTLKYPVALAVIINLQESVSEIAEQLENSRLNLIPKSQTDKNPACDILPVHQHMSYSANDCVLTRQFQKSIASRTTTTTV